MKLLCYQFLTNILGVFQSVYCSQTTCFLIII